MELILSVTDGGVQGLESRAVARTSRSITFLTLASVTLDRARPVCHADLISRDGKTGVIAQITGGENNAQKYAKDALRQAGVRP